MTAHPLESLVAAAGGRPIVLFDGSCPLCSREIAHYRRLDTAERVAWWDIAHDPDCLAGSGIDHGHAMARFHVIAPDGEIVTGAHGFVRMWRELPGWRWLGRLCRWTGLVWPLEGAYRVFARRRARRRGNCAA